MHQDTFRGESGQTPTLMTHSEPTMNKNVLLLLAAITSSGCAGIASTPHPVHMKIGAIDTLSTSASVTSLIIKSDDSQRFCAQPIADATFSESEGNSFSIMTMPGSNESDSMSEASASDEMQGRVPALLMARELFYRLCELSLNNPGQLDVILPLYEKTLDVVGAGWMKESERYTITESINTAETITNSGSAAPKTSTSVMVQNEDDEDEDEDEDEDDYNDYDSADDDNDDQQS